jgi:rhodanese-related sulfurtransferase
MQNGNEAVETVDVEATWQLLAARFGSQLIDVRTRAEWVYVGIPDLGPLGKRAVRPSFSAVSLDGSRAEICSTGDLLDR